MLQYLSVMRVDTRSSKGKVKSGLPFGLESIAELPARKNIPAHEKLRLITEQGILAHYAIDMLEGHSVELADYRNQLMRIALVSVPEQNDSMDRMLYRTYRETMLGVLRGRSQDLYNATNMLADHQNFSRDGFTIPKDFYEPYLKVITGRCGTKSQTLSPDHVGAMLLVPHVRKLDRGMAMVFKPHTFVRCHLYEKYALPDMSPSMEYMMRLDWTGKHWMQVTDAIQSFGLNLHKKLEAGATLPGVLATIIRGNSSPLFIRKKVRSQFVGCMKHLVQRYRIGVDSFDALQTVLSGLGYKGLEFLTSACPTNRELAAFESLTELQFIKPYKLQVALEAAESEEEEEKPADQDELEDDPETDPDAETSDEDPGAGDEPADDAGAEDPETGDDAGADEDTDDFGMGDEEGGDDSGTDSGGSDSGNGAEQTDTPSDPKDPFSIPFDVTQSESMDEYFARESICAALTNVVKNPPETMSSETLAFLRVWLTQWVNLVSVETTKAVLSQLAVTIDL